MVDLEKSLKNRRWQRRLSPFPHFVANDVFADNVYHDLEAGYKEIMARGLSDHPDPARFSRSVSGYDVYAFNFQAGMPEAFEILLSRQWHDMIAAVAGIEATGDVNGGFHHHAAGSGNGKPHNDLNPGWFSGEPSPAGINLANHAECNYHHGTSKKSHVVTRETVRAAALLIYLNNPEWKEGDGGQTALYRVRTQDVEAADGHAAPINNSLLLFECTPHSYHAFIGNRYHPRNSIIMWLHRRVEDVVNRWGPRAVVKWPT
jgi:hypothetical protein